MIKSLGVIRVAAAGVPQRVTLNELNPTDKFTVHGFMFQALPGNAGKIYVGNANLNRATYAGVYAFIAIPTANVIQTFSAALTLSPAGIRLDDMWIDADQNNDGIIASVLIT